KDFPEERRKAERDFAEFQRGMKLMKGDYYDAKDTAELSAKLTTALKMRYFLEPRSAEIRPDDLPEEGADLRLVGQDLSPVKIPRPGTLDVLLKRSKLHPSGKEQRVRAEAGDLLVLELVEKDSALLFRRQMYYETHTKANPGNGIKD